MKRELPGGGGFPEVDLDIGIGSFTGQNIPINSGSSSLYVPDIQPTTANLNPPSTSIQAVNSIVASGGSQGQDAPKEVKSNTGGITLEEFLGTGSGGASAHGELPVFLTDRIDSGILGVSLPKAFSLPGSQGVDIESGNGASGSNDFSGEEVKVSNTDSTTNGSPQPPNGASGNSGNRANDSSEAPEHSGGGQPSDQPSGQPNEQPKPSGQPSGQPSGSPSAGPNQSDSGPGDGSQNNDVGDNGSSRNSSQGSNSDPSSPNSVQTPSASNGSPSDPSNDSNGAPNSGGAGTTKPAGSTLEVTTWGDKLYGDLVVSS